jgi:Domain of unknown function (DUF1906)
MYSAISEAQEAAMEQILGVDMSAPFPASAAACLRSAGVRFIGRYYTSIENDPKLLTLTEAQLICAAGFRIAVLYEDDGTSFSTTLGSENAAAALQQAQAVGQPEQSAIYFAVDYDAQADDLAGAIIPYFRAVNAAFGELYAVGVYGSGLVCNSIINAGLASHAWLSQSAGWCQSTSYTGWSVKQGGSTTQCNLSVDPDIAIPPFGAFEVRL